MNPFQDLFDAQKAYFATNVTRTTNGGSSNSIEWGG